MYVTYWGPTQNFIIMRRNIEGLSNVYGVQNTTFIEGFQWIFSFGGTCVFERLEEYRLAYNLQCIRSCISTREDSTLKSVLDIAEGCQLCRARLSADKTKVGRQTSISPTPPLVRVVGCRSRGKWCCSRCSATCGCGLCGRCARGVATCWWCFATGGQRLRRQTFRRAAVTVY